mmetsp:Transcript_22882/g.58187  ORF Transcript_22882/g.58187 Transcript_22882/m.58187 type:complete len:305 (-) Transcript_22882:211-1125(-)
MPAGPGCVGSRLSAAPPPPSSDVSDGSPLCRAPRRPRALLVQPHSCGASLDEQSASSDQSGGNRLVRFAPSRQPATAVRPTVSRASRVARPHRKPCAPTRNPASSAAPPSAPHAGKAGGLPLPLASKPPAATRRNRRYSRLRHRFFHSWKWKPRTSRRRCRIMLARTLPRLARHSSHTVSPNCGMASSGHTQTPSRCAMSRPVADHSKLTLAPNESSIGNVAPLTMMASWMSRRCVGRATSSPERSISWKTLIIEPRLASPHSSKPWYLNAESILRRSALRSYALSILGTERMSRKFPFESGCG